MAKKQTAGRDHLGKLAPKFAELNDDVLFGEVWSREKELSPRDRSMITIAALFSAGLYPQLKAHLFIGKDHGVTKQEAVEIVTQLAFYCGWPKAWSTFPLIQEVYGDEENELDGVPSNLSVFPVGEKNPYGQYFIGQSYLAPLSVSQVPVFNVTFEPGCRNNWTDADLRQWPRLVPGMGSGSPRASSRRCSEHPRGCQALAWCGL